MMRGGVRLILAALLTAAAAVPGDLVARAQAAPAARDCQAQPPGGHDPKAQIEFTARVTDKRRARIEHGKTFEYGQVRDVTIEVRWEKLDQPARQRVEVYGPDGHLYQLFTTSLPARPDPVALVMAVRGTSIESVTLAGTWCAKVFLDDDLDPVAAEDFELTSPRGR